MHKDPEVAMLSVTALIPAVTGLYLGLPIADSSVAKVLVLPVKPSSLPASGTVLCSGTVDNG